MLFGAHESVAGGLFTAIGRAQVDGCAALQIFTKNSNMWREPALDAAAIAAFQEAKRAFGGTVLAHTSYLINLATDRADLLAQSKDALVAEVRRSSSLGVEFCVLHPGAHLGAGEDEGVRRVAAALLEVLERTDGCTARILLENTAGQGTCVGHAFEHLGAILAECNQSPRLGVCLDTQHAWAAGYDWSTAEGYAQTFEAFDRHVGLSRLAAFHLNDSKKPRGSRVDRHEHIGEGELGLPLFWRLANDARFARVPAVVETEPREGSEPYKAEVALLRSLVGAAPPPATFALAVQAPAPKRRRS